MGVGRAACRDTHRRIPRDIGGKTRRRASHASASPALRRHAAAAPAPGGRARTFERRRSPRRDGTIAPSA
ncbi:hypothetical protein BURPS1710A_3426 [Burkholderia pseudomallei 1710a]|uniref:Uncharacterized protein n=1 Tax=Burkholderia pseudomallei 1710a TaxID=320371 RepID=A0A0E1W3R7_BURPE|nr:hypothetical protein BURPS1710A_3426 [Burkholderia pseudomallei 1710a]